MKPNLFQQFFKSEKAGGLILILCTLVSLILANSPLGKEYAHFWHIPASLRIGGLTIPFRIEEWINDGLMTIFFLLVGLEIEREIYIGELSAFKNAILPAVAAIGGMLVPAAIHFLFNHGKPEQAGIGIPMATDIAFSLGVLSLLGSRVPQTLKIFLTALAIIDDLGAVIIIAIFYTQSFSGFFLFLALALFAILILLNRLRVFSLWIYLPAGIILWYFLYRSGVHPTLSGILLAFAIPFRKNMENQPSARLQHALHTPVNFFIIPLFALANTAIHLAPGWHREMGSANSLGITLGLLLGKPLGIAGFSLLAVSVGLASLPKDMNRANLLGTGLLAGIGFTMSIFISNLAFSTNPQEIQNSKVAVLLASLCAAVTGWFLLRRSLDKTVNHLPV
ncbi:MAG: Na+/H+ antiporter NhaA [Bacteroidota bacterium]|nr:Na+/H+ antiporter NhaA [Bacteroidota bacterium]MDP4211538.1 Na+/H+ antiporter NhaA [Bacteroidota bacterium]MDP4249753.1 Na+/H+ antiporter NhaA [Bacteroidota bacterium]